MSDREAFVSAIAANPADDLPRLVFADWLDEHGEAERAEFIREQIALCRIRWSGAEVRSADLQAYLARVEVNRTRFRNHWPEWFAAVTHGLHGSPEPFEASWWTDVDEDTYLSLMRKDPKRTIHPTAFQYRVARGFVMGVGVGAGDEPGPLGFADALRAEPIDTLIAALHDDPAHWNALTDPSLRRITHLDVTGYSGRFGPTARGVWPVFHDSHLAGVRSLSFAGNSDFQIPFEMLPATTVAEFARSPLAYRINELCIRVDDGGLRALARSDRFALHTLRLHFNQSTADGRKALAAARWRGSVERLTLGGFDSRGEPIHEVLQGGWLKLRELRMRETYPTDADLVALAESAFVARLEVLDLAHNDSFPADGEGFRRLCAALNPTVLRRFVLPCGPIWQVPDALKQRFGSAVTLNSE